MTLSRKIKLFILRHPTLPLTYSILTFPFQNILKHKKRVLLNNSKSNKKVSVIVPNYNYAKFLKDRITSIVQQTYPIYEIIILDDASTDDSKKIINNLIEIINQKYPKIKTKTVSNKINSGSPYKQWQKGFALATGDYIWIAEADDLSDKNFLATVMNGFLNKDVVLSCSGIQLINERGSTIMYDFSRSFDKGHTNHWKKDYINSGIDEIRNYLANNCTIPNVSGVVFKNDARIPYSNYLTESIKFKQAGDWLFYINVLRHGKIAYFRPSLNKYRIHSRSVTTQSDKSIHSREIKQIQQFIAGLNA